MDGIELVGSILLALVMGVVFGFVVCNLLTPSYSVAYDAGFSNCTSQTTPLIEKAQGIVNACADKAMIVIDQRDKCNTDLAVCMNNLNHVKGFGE